MTALSSFRDCTSACRIAKHVAAILLLASASIAAGQEPLREVASAAEAVQLAERFIVEQGYTETAGNPLAFQPELFSDHLLDPATILEERKGTTSPKAYAYWKDDVTGSFQWWIYFEYIGDGDAECPTVFRVVNLWEPEPDYGRGLLVVNDVLRSLDPDATLLSERSPAECPSASSEGAR